MAIWKIHYPSWEMECCGTPFSVGDEVAWIVQLESPDDLTPGLWDDCYSEVEGVLHPLTGEDGPGAVLRAGGLTALWAAPPPYPAEPSQAVGSPQAAEARQVAESWQTAEPPQAVAAPYPPRARLTGLLSVNDHGPEPEVVPQTTGRVRAIHVVTRGFRETAPGSRTLVPVPGELRLRPERTCPKWFADEVPTEPGGTVGHRSETGVLVTLETPDTPA
ncbi:DUF6578 domain-containing protein [Streptomyces sp. NPDC002055]|uniref:DUF6578 domain-containing protein n=1 Tax=Streptomyces sp. NPDC002055 TaxID=3154534 RepID=UPI0033289DEF